MIGSDDDFPGNIFRVISFQLFIVPSYFDPGGGVRKNQYDAEFFLISLTYYLRMFNLGD